MQDRIPLYPGRVKMTPVAGQANTYDMVRADDPTQAGTPINKATLLKDATAALFGKTNAAVPDDILSLLSKSVLAQTVGGNTDLTDVLGTKLTVGVQIETGSYVGTGNYGASNPNTLTFASQPKLVIIFGGYTIFAMNPAQRAPTFSSEGDDRYYTCHLTWSGNQLSWLSYANERYQCNTAGETYHYIAIG